MTRYAWYKGLIVYLHVVGSLMAMDVTCKSKLYIENNSGWALTIKCSFQGNKNVEMPMRKGEKLKEIGCLETIQALTFERRGQVWGFGASIVSLDQYLKQLQREAANKSGKDAFIVINATMTSWNYSIRWEAGIQGSLVMEEDFFEPMPTQSKTDWSRFEDEPFFPTTQEEKKVKPVKKKVSLKEVQNGALGSEYANKANEIMQADYTTVVKQGKPDLSNHLEKEFSIVKVEKVTAEKDAAKQTEVSKFKQIMTPKSISVDKAKQVIDSTYRVLQKHKANKLVL